MKTLESPHRLYNDSFLHSRSFAYCKGFVDAYKRGVENNTFETDRERVLYKLGYEAGITEYCNATHPDE